MKTRYPSNFTFTDRPGHWHHIAPGHNDCACGATFCARCGIRTLCRVGWNQPTRCTRCGGQDPPMPLSTAKDIACRPHPEPAW